MPLRRVLAVAIALAAVAGCRRPAPAPGPWTRFDLWATRPEVEVAAPRHARPFVRRLGFLGAAEVRDMSQVPAAQLAAFPRRTAGQIRVLEQRFGSRLRWRVELGAEPYFSFVPVPGERPSVYAVAVRDDAGATSELHRRAAAPAHPLAHAAVVLDLGRWAGRRVDLLLAVEAATATPVAAGPPGRAGWGSPEVWSRRAAPAAAPAARDGRPNIVLIGADTLRADAVGPRPGRASLTPALDRLAAESDVWPDAYTCFNITNPSFASILTGLYGKNHGVYDLHTRLPAEHSTLPELLAGAGYRTLAVIAARHLGDHNSGLAQGFGTVLTAAEHDAAELAATSAMDWIDQAAEPFFVWLHLFDPHTPHTPPAPFALGYRAATASGLAPATGWTPFRPPGPRTFAEPVLGAHADLYDGEVAYLDRQVDRLLGFLASRGLLERTLVVFVADHGENLGEHGIRFRHVGLFTTTTHVPLVVRWPGAAGTGRRRAGLVQTIDLFPTLLRAAGVAVPPSDGVDLDVLTGDGRRGRRAVFAEHGNGSGAMVRTATHAYATSRGNPLLPDGPSLFDLAADPAETRNLAGSGLAVEAELARLLAAWQADRRALRGEARPHALQPEEAERLRSLGYLQ